MKSENLMYIYVFKNVYGIYIYKTMVDFCKGYLQTANKWLIYIGTFPIRSIMQKYVSTFMHIYTS